jgi:hypothetical protein
VRRIAVAAALAAACQSPTPAPDPGPLDKFFFPTGMQVVDHRLVVASSDADLTYAADTGGTVIAVDVDPQAVAGALNVPSLAGELAVATPGACPALGAAGRGATVVVPIRGRNLVYPLALGADGALSCSGCELSVGSPDRSDPFTVGVACGPGLARAFVGYLQAGLGLAWFTQIDLLKSPGEDGYLRHHSYGDVGRFRGFAYDAARSRLYLTRAGTVQGTIRWIDLSNGCLVDQDVASGGCATGLSRSGAFPIGFELRKIALANAPSADGRTRRAYITARVYDPNVVASGADFDGYLLVADLSDDAEGRLQVTLVDRIPIGYGAEHVEVLPARPGKRDVVAALAVRDGVLWIYDDDTGARVAIGRDLGTGAPLAGQDPFGVAVDPVPFPGNAAQPLGIVRVYVASFTDSFVTPVDVPLDAPETAAPVAPGGTIRRIGPELTP